MQNINTQRKAGSSNPFLPSSSSRDLSGSSKKDINRTDLNRDFPKDSTKVKHDKAVVPPSQHDLRSNAYSNLNRDRTTGNERRYDPTQVNRDGTDHRSSRHDPHQARPGPPGNRPPHRHTNVINTRCNGDEPCPIDMKSVIKAKTKPPPGSKVVWNSKKDKGMAVKQASYDKLPEKEKKEQDDWVNSKLPSLGLCPQNFNWNRSKGGYHCAGGNHFLTDELITEGKRGVWNVPLDLDGKWAVYWGPYYPDPCNENRMLWGGAGERPDEVPPASFCGRYDFEDGTHSGKGPTWEEMNKRAIGKMLNAMGQPATPENIKRLNDKLDKIVDLQRQLGGQGIPGKMPGTGSKGQGTGPGKLPGLGSKDHGPGPPRLPGMPGLGFQGQGGGMGRQR